jgi:RecA-family ATPase
MSRLNLIADAAQLIKDIKSQIPADITPGVVFIDTLNRSLVGSESKDEDMAKYLAAAEGVATKLECAVAIVHHCGIDASRPRGHHLTYRFGGEPARHSKGQERRRGGYG